MVENGFLLVKADEGLVSPIGTLFIERYEAFAVQAQLTERKDDIQVVTLRTGQCQPDAVGGRRECAWRRWGEPMPRCATTPMGWTPCPSS